MSFPSSVFRFCYDHSYSHSFFPLALQGKAVQFHLQVCGVAFFCDFRSYPCRFEHQPTTNSSSQIHPYNRSLSAHQYVTNDMTDDIQSHLPTKKEETKPSSLGSNRGPKRQPSNPSSLRGGSSGARPASRGSTKKSPTTTTSAAESGSDTASRKGDGNNRKQDQRGKNQNGSGRGLPHRKAQASTSHVTRNVGSNKPSSSPAPAQSAESSDALSSLQRVIQDLKTSSPSQQSAIGSQGP